jgi:hypothetical protein
LFRNYKYLILQKMSFVNELLTQKYAIMNSLVATLKTIILLCILSVFVACNGEGSDNEVGGQDSLLSSEGYENQTHYGIPSPEGLFSFIKKGNLKFSKAVLNPTSNIDNYIDTRLKELNFGIYSADLAYVASFNKYQESVDYLNTVRTLSDEIDISKVFDQNLIGRIDNIIDDKDSLLKVTSDAYSSIVRYLESANRKKSYALIATGGWIETNYVVANLIENYKQDAKVIDLLASQKHVFANLYATLEQLKSDESIQRTINDLQGLKVFYESLQIQQDDTKSTTKAEGDKIVVGGNAKIIMTEDQFNTLKKEITIVRNKITNI